MESFQPFGHMLHEHYVRKFRKASCERQEKLKSLKTTQDALAYVQSAKEKIRKAFGPFPQRTPLNPEITGTVEWENYTVEKVIFYSRPDFPVTANLYLPKGVSGKRPAVLGVCGHSADGKAEPVYQKFCASLAAMGYVVLIYDPASQGERFQFLETGEDVSGNLCGEHNMYGKQLRLAGEFFGSWRVWDGIRALDYLLSRPEVDTSRVGVTGNSGGGTLSAYLNAIDDRFTMAASSCFITTYLRNMENELPCDSEQTPYNIIGSGCDMSDFVIAQAPRPTLILGQKNDFFDPRGTYEAYEDAKHVYGLLGCEDNVKVFVGNGNHGYNLDNREAMYAFFNSHAEVDMPGQEPEQDTIPVEQLKCTPKGQVEYLENNKHIREFVSEMADEQKAVRAEMSNEQLKEYVVSALGLVPDCDAPDFRMLRFSCDGKLFMSRFAIDGDDGLQSVMGYTAEQYYFHMPEGEKARLHLPHTSAREEAAEDAALVNADDGVRIFTLDVRGSGEFQPQTCDLNQPLFNHYGFDYFYASSSIMLGESYLGDKVNDVIRAVKLLKASGFKEVELSGRGLGAVIAAFAGLACAEVDKVSLNNYLPSYDMLMHVAATKWPLSHFVPGILKHTDLPEIYRVLSAKNLSLSAPWDAKMNEMK